MTNKEKYEELLGAVEGVLDYIKQMEEPEKFEPSPELDVIRDVENWLKTGLKEVCPESVYLK